MKKGERNVLLTKADNRNRTGDLLITNEVRYHLCHVSWLIRFLLLNQWKRNLFQS